MILAIQVGMAELSNTSDWQDYCEEADADKVIAGMHQLEKLLN